APVDWGKFEAWLGVRGLGWAAIVLLFFATAYFLKLVFERGYIGELGRVMIGALIGSCLCIVGREIHGRGYRIFCQMLTAGGIVILYLSVFASFGYYHLLTNDHAAPFLVLLVAEAFGLALLYDASAIALMAVIGGLLTPILLHTGIDQHEQLFTYLGILNAGV